MSLVMISFLVIAMAEETFNYFEDKGDEITDNIVGVIASSAQEFFSGIELQQLVGDEIMPEGMPESSDMCGSLDTMEFPDEEIRAMIEQRCMEGEAKGMSFVGVMPDTEGLIQEAVDVRIAEFEESLKESIKEGFDIGIMEGRGFIKEYTSQFFFLELRILALAFAFLLLLYFLNNDLVIFINYLAKELVAVLTIIFLFPYIVFKTNVFGWFLEKVDILGMLEFPLPVNPQLVIAKIVEAISAEFTSFYGQYVQYAGVAVLAGIILMIGNKFILMPLFLKRMVEKKEEKIEEKKEELKEKKEEKKEKPRKKVKKKTTKKKGKKKRNKKKK